MLKEDFYQYWTVRKDYSREPFYTFDLAMLTDDIGEEMSGALMIFLSAHYMYNDADNQPLADQKLELEETMIGAIAILVEDFPRYLYIDTLNALQAGIANGDTQISPTNTSTIKYHGFHHYD